MMDLNTKIKRMDGIIETEVDGNKVLMSIENGKYYGLNEVATSIWKKTENTIAVENLINQLLEEYDVDNDKCTAQVFNYLKELEVNSLISIS